MGETVAQVDFNRGQGASSPGQDSLLQAAAQAPANPSADPQRLYGKLLDRGGVGCVKFKNQPKWPSSKTVRKIRHILSFALRLVATQRLIPRNFAEGCALSKPEHKEMQTLTQEQWATFFREANATSVYDLYYCTMQIWPPACAKASCCASSERTSTRS